MYSTALPNLDSYNNKETKLRENAVIFASTNNKYFYPEHKTPYLFVTNYQNKGRYILNKRHIEISDKHFYFLNANDDLEINFQKGVPVTTLLILFEKNFIENCFGYLRSSNEELLDSPIGELNNELELPSVPFYSNSIIQGKISELLRKSVDQQGLDNLLFEFITEFSLLNRNTHQQIKKIKEWKNKKTKQQTYLQLMTQRLRQLELEESSFFLTAPKKQKNGMPKI